jgi:hypothetical protein
MAEIIIVEGERLDLYPNSSVSLNVKLNDISDISTRNSTYSNTSKVPATSRNKKIFGFLGVSGNKSVAPYRKLNCRYFKNGLAVIVDGYIQVTKTTDKEFYFVLYDGVIDLSEKLLDKKIGDLAGVAILNHTRTSSGVQLSLGNVEGYIYAVQRNHKINLSDDINGVDLPAGITLNRFMPSFFVKTIFTLILDEAGYEYEGEIFDNLEFADEVFTMSKGAEDDDIDFSVLFPVISQKDFIKDVLNRYGLLMRKNESKLEFRYFKDIVNGLYGSVDLSDNLIEISSEVYDSGFAQVNEFSFNYQESLNSIGDFSFGIDDETLKPFKPIYTSVFDVSDDFEIWKFILPDFEFVYVLELLEAKVDSETGIEELKSKSRKSSLFKVNRTGGDWKLRLTINDDYVDVIGNEVQISNESTRWQFYLNNYYVRFQDIFNNYKEVNAVLKFNPLQIYNLDLFKSYHLRSKGQYYYMNSIKIKDGIGQAKLIQINGLLNDNEFIDVEEGAQIIITSAQLYDANPPYTYSGGIISIYDVLEYSPSDLIIKYIKIDAPFGSPTGIIIEDNSIIVDTPEGGAAHNQQIPYIYDENYCGWWRIFIEDPVTGIVSNEVEILIDCTVPPPPASIDIISYFYDPVDDPERIGYKFNNFTPSSAVLSIRGFNFITLEPFGTPIVYNLNNLNQDILHVLDDIILPNEDVNNVYYHVEIETDTINKTVVTLL